MDSRNVVNADLKSRKEVNKHINALNMYYVYGCEDNNEKDFISKKIDSLREYKNTYFPKKKFFDLFKVK
jgi:hypothetical protein